MSNIKRLLQAIFELFWSTFFSYSFPVQQQILLSLITLLVILWTNEALPLEVVSLLPIVIFPICGVLNTTEITSVYSKPIIFLFLGGFLLVLPWRRLILLSSN